MAYVIIALVLATQMVLYASGTEGVRRAAIYLAAIVFTEQETAGCSESEIDSPFVEPDSRILIRTGKWCFAGYSWICCPACLRGRTFNFRQAVWP